MHRVRPFLHPISRCIYLNRCKPTIHRTFTSTRPASKISKKDALAGLDMFDELVETGNLTPNMETGKLTADAKSVAIDTAETTTEEISQVDPEENDLEEDGEISSDLLEMLAEGDVTSLLNPSTGFEPRPYFQNWSLEAMEPSLTKHGLTLFSYLTYLIEEPITRLVLARLDEHQALDFKKRWIAYELDQGNPHAHLPLIEFFLKCGMKMLPPISEPFEIDDRLESIDGKDALDALSKADISGSWIVKQPILGEPDDDKLEYPDLMTPDAILDPRDVLDLPPSKETPFHNRVIVRNHRSVFHDYAEGLEDDLLAEDELPEDENKDQDEMMQALPVSTRYYKDLQQSILMRRRVVQQTGKGKIRRIAFMVLVGDGNGLVGYGEGKHALGATALKAARIAAVRNMDYVERFEERTTWTEMSTKLGSTHLIVRPRPVGFGLRCNPNLHRIFRAAGLKDVSAKVWGSRNKLNVIKAAFRLLHSGHAPTGMGNGLGGKGKKLAKGSGMKGKADLERARGRKLISLR